MGPSVHVYNMTATPGDYVNHKGMWWRRERLSKGERKKQNAQQWRRWVELNNVARIPQLWRRKKKPAEEQEGKRESQTSEVISLSRQETDQIDFQRLQLLFSQNHVTRNGQSLPCTWRNKSVFWVNSDKNNLYFYHHIHWTFPSRCLGHSQWEFCF